MSHTPQIIETELPASLQHLKDRNDRYANNAKAANTKKAYKSDFADFKIWCDRQEISLPSLPATPDCVGAYLAYLAEERNYKISTIERRIASISQAHKHQGYETPTTSQRVKDIMQAIRRTYAPEQTVRKVRPAVTSIIARMVDPLGNSLMDIRDRALLLIGFAGAFRRSELAEMHHADITEVEDGLRIVLRKSKTDQEGKGFIKGIPYGQDERTCPVRAWRAWVKAAGITDGQAFRALGKANEPGRSLSGQRIACMIKCKVSAAGLDPAQFSGHSLRSGLITTAVQAGQPERDIMRQSGHKHLPTMRGYIHEASLFTNNVAAKVGL
ncbi:MAG TPA: site-specific integrase [Ktedonobacteraceae bacterium]|nr:site-specific integrase [Ktedonobacteraceae bacterium]